MRVFFQIALIVLYITASNSSIYSSVTGTLSDYFKQSLRNLRDRLKPEVITERSRFKIKHERAQTESKPLKAIIKKIKSASESNPRHAKKERARKSGAASLNQIMKTNRIKNQSYRFDPFYNEIQRRKIGFRRADSDTDTSDSSSSSLELKNWKDEWREHWIKKKIEALKATQEQGDVVNMVAARPWGVPCGDPAQHDMPWGTCMMAMQCEAEYRIYRGDFQCSRSKFVCCALQLTDFDMYQGFDPSFEDSGLTTDSEEKRNRGKGSKEKKRRKRRREKKRRKKARENRKKKIKKNIKKIIKEMRKILNRQYRNGTSQRKKKTKQLKKFIKDLKKKYRNDRKSVKNVHEIQMVKVDAALMKKLNEIKRMNINFVKNDTFRDIVVNGTMTRQGARMLVEAYPDLTPFFTDNTRRKGNADEPNHDYDVEYGMLYY